MLGAYKNAAADVQYRDFDEATLGAFSSASSAHRFDYLRGWQILLRRSARIIN
jgi:hypothetical protein